MPESFVVQPGTLADYDMLAALHYRADRPATRVRVLAARTHGHTTPNSIHAPARTIGVLVVSMPAINAPWRAIAWPGRYDRCGRSTSQSAAIARANREIRVISRVIVSPPWRGRGVASSLVRSYLAAPCTPRTEALAVMGDLCPFFQSAGMQRIEFPPARRVLRLHNRLAALDIAPWSLVDGAALLLTLSAARRAQLEQTLRVFAGAHRDTRAHAHAPLLQLIAIAARRVMCHPTAFVHGPEIACLPRREKSRV